MLRITGRHFSTGIHKICSFEQIFGKYQYSEHLSKYLANINILSACSPIFKDILKKVKVSSTVMYLREIKYSELDSIMQFIYLGEATFYDV